MRVQEEKKVMSDFMSNESFFVNSILHYNGSMTVEALHEDYIHMEMYGNLELPMSEDQKKP